MSHPQADRDDSNSESLLEELSDEGADSGDLPLLPGSESAAKTDAERALNGDSSGSLMSDSELSVASDSDVPELAAIDEGLDGDSEGTIERESVAAELPDKEPPTCEMSSGDAFGDLIELSVSSVDAEESSEPLPHGATAIKKSGRRETIPKQIGDYQIKKLIGSGGMGEVFLAEHVRMQREVALKVLRGDRMSDESSIERFYDEVRAASRVMHPNIVTAFDAGEADGIHFLVMEYVDGMTLTRLVAKNGPLSPGMAASVIRQAALGLLHAHRAGIVHRDVKPGNLIQAKDGTIKVLDLGLAQISNVLWSDDGREIGRIQDPDSYHKRKGKLIGTLAYMSPEQLESPDDADPRSDIYSLGAVLYFLLTGKPPFQGEYLEQVYGHRHGEIPDLMQVRSDVDLGLANLFRRMMAKRLSERYASLDEVIEDLGTYAEESHSPAWLSEFVNRQSTGDQSTLSGGSTAIANLAIFGIDLGMSYSAAAESLPGVGIHNLTAGADSQPLFRMAVADDHGQLLFDVEANQMRFASPKQVVHCLPMYVGKDTVQREIAGRQCPPEVLMSMLIRRIIANAWPDNPLPQLAAIAIPASYDQFHRRSIKQACRLAGIESIRLVDRSVAAVQALMLDSENPTPSDAEPPENLPIDYAGVETMLFLGLTGQASEVALIKRDSMQLTQVASAGHWHTGMLTWQHRLVEMAAQGFRDAYGFDPTRSSVTASRLQMSCERAMNALLLMPNVTISMDLDDRSLSITLQRDKWLDRCDDLIHGIRQDMHQICKQAGVRPKRIDSCVMLGPLLRIPGLRARLLENLDPKMPIRYVDRSDVARGSAACLAAELPQRSEVLLPPRCVSSQTIGIVIEDNQGRRRILPIIARGTSLPARTNRKLSIAKNRDSMTLSVVESSGIRGDQWHSLGRYEFNVDKDSSNQLKRTRLIGFELNVDGLLSVRAQTPGTPESTRLPTIPEPLLAIKDEPEWAKWLVGLEP
ncbi:Hsp70 family protein [Stieleria sp. TO1_6]|uniref:protein kinase domain-containing protein n=1 Tax=Stieleria tagensis TaxID=2956795 RepID=UPI00209B0CF2|nr:Hsp70 family protein [Stieleria tagensis]MCO8125300.1 Hsp70 family protein [Stieleria tagensis]